MDISLTLTDDERHACRRAAILLRSLSAGLAGIGTRQEADACAGYAATLDSIAPGATARLDLSVLKPDGRPAGLLGRFTVEKV